MIIYSIVIPVLPFHLEHLGYSGVSSLVGYLLFAYVGGYVWMLFPVSQSNSCFTVRRSRDMCVSETTFGCSNQYSICLYSHSGNCLDFWALDIAASTFDQWPGRAYMLPSDAYGSSSLLGNGSRSSYPRNEFLHGVDCRARIIVSVADKFNGLIFTCFSRCDTAPEHSLGRTSLTMLDECWACIRVSHDVT